MLPPLGGGTPAAPLPAAPAPRLRIVEVHRPMRGPVLFNVLGADGQPIHPAPLPHDKATALANDPPAPREPAALPTL